MGIMKCAYRPQVESKPEVATVIITPAGTYVIVANWKVPHVHPLLNFHIILLLSVKHSTDVMYTHA